ncbi:MAG TPA: prepilin-type N-terminal cleavage/methylation domain-containing protein [Pyrinomonadaceae bacterium]|jgi:prepilin-type N-terminal cleavage/methylation domain-containing protein
MKRKQMNGFSLIELLIVVAIIGIIAAIAIPSLLASRRAANEGSATSSMRTIHSAQFTYQSTLGNGNYGSLADLLSRTLVDPELGAGRKSGYNFVLSAATIDNASNPKTYYFYSLPATTSGIGQTGTRRFAMTEAGVLRGDNTLVAPANRGAADAITALGN